MNETQFKTLFPNASKSMLEANGFLRGPEPEQDQTPALGTPENRETKSLGRISVCFKGYRVRPLDPDNFAGGCKDLLDGLRHAGLIPEDTIREIRFQTEQTQVAKYRDQRTEITITYP